MYEILFLHIPLIFQKKLPISSAHFQAKKSEAYYVTSQQKRTLYCAGTKC